MSDVYLSPFFVKGPPNKNAANSRWLSTTSHQVCDEGSGEVGVDGHACFELVDYRFCSFLSSVLDHGKTYIYQSRTGLCYPPASLSMQLLLW